MRSLLLWLPLLSTSTIVQIAGCPIIDTSKPPGTGTPSTRANLDAGFESGLANWVQDQDLPLDPNRPGQNVAASVTLSTTQASEGTDPRSSPSTERRVTEPSGSSISSAYWATRTTVLP